MSILAVLFITFAAISWSKTAEEWKSRTIYQLLTDRFGRTDDDTFVCEDLSNYCGGTFKGIAKNLDYLQELGVDAIWISPVAENAPGSYHGYWYTNFYHFNPYFGTSQDFTDLVTACHARDIWIMVDVVFNHAGPVPNVNGRDYDFSGIYPFNEAKFYHWPATECKMIDESDPTNQDALEKCWSLNLPDLNHEDEYVANTLIYLAQEFISKFKLDGLRIDAARHVPKWFWKKISEATGVFTIGEALNFDVKYCAGYQTSLDSLLNFPLYKIIDEVFREKKDMSLLTRYYKVAYAEWRDISVLGNFVASHDLPRLLHNDTTVGKYKTYYTFILTAIGIPIIYYGDEQSFSGGVDPKNRETLWGKMNTNAEMYQFLKAILAFRKQAQLYSYEQIESLADLQFYAFSRGDYFFAFTNSDEKQVRTIKSHPYVEGTFLCELLNQNNCVQVKDGEFQVTINQEPKILVPKKLSESDSLTSSAWENLQQIWNKITISDSIGHNPQYKSQIK